MRYALILAVGLSSTVFTQAPYRTGEEGIQKAISAAATRFTVITARNSHRFAAVRIGQGKVLAVHVPMGPFVVDGAPAKTLEASAMENLMLLQVANDNLPLLQIREGQNGEAFHGMWFDGDSVMFLGGNFGPPAGNMLRLEPAFGCANGCIGAALYSRRGELVGLAAGLETGRNATIAFTGGALSRFVNRVLGMRAG